MIHHVGYNCPKRLSECPLRCGNVYQFNSLKGSKPWNNYCNNAYQFPYLGHVQLCPKRIISCDPTMKVCERFLYSWFYKEISRENETAHHVRNTGTKDSYTIEEAGGPLSLATPITTTLNLHQQPSLEQSASSPLSVDFFSVDGSVNMDSNSITYNGKGMADGVDLEKSVQQVSTAKSLSMPQLQSSNKSSSIYFDTFHMKLFENLRFHVCERHNCTAMMSAIRCVLVYSIKIRNSCLCGTVGMTRLN